MRAKTNTTFPATKEEGDCVAKLGDVFLRAPPEQRARAVDSLLEGNPDTFKLKLLSSAGKLGLALAEKHQAVYETMKAKSDEHSRKVSTGIRDRQEAKAQAQQILSHRIDPAQGLPVEATAASSEAPEKTIMEKLADLARPDPRDPIGPLAPRRAPTPLSPGSSLPGAQHPPRSLPPEPNK